ncbi:tripartite tricarboxylate transporter substrate binding protein [Ideonella sp. A 288]|uniref:Bug family tripartite tricarboxylate transporter substrate binding protein n=1 Tax=Ideonella sp. A 288 TaxID=1962181 RepID=UPI000B4B890B|nr:tripartite tricarboxylate transporter substrate binding protein [Ideonella sp. A 288]
MLTRARFTRRAAAALLLAGSLAALLATPPAQAFPTAGKPVRIIVPFPPGGQTDIQARMMAQRLQQSLGVPVLVENKPGASTIIGAQEVVRAAPDGHTLLYTIAITAAQNPHLFSKLPYDGLKDLTPVMFVARSSTVLTVPAAAPYSTLRELVAYAKANPGKLNFGSFSLGSTSHLVGEMLMQQAGIEMVHVPFKGSGDATVALIGNQVQLLFDGPTTAINNAKAGKVKMLAVTDSKPYAALGGVPTMAEAGVPGIDVPGGMQMFGPARMPPDVVAKVNAALAAALKSPEVEKLFIDGGTEILASSAEDHARSVKEQHERWGAVIRKLGLKLD